MYKSVMARNMAYSLAIAFIFTVFYYYSVGMFYEKSFPFNTFLPGPVTRFGDLYGTIDIWVRMKFNGVGYGSSYFPSMYLLVDLLYSTFKSGPVIALNTAFLSLTIFIFIRATSYFSMFERVSISVLLTVASYPVLFTVHTANLEIFVFIFIVLFVWAYSSANYKLSSAFIGYAISMKLFPGIFLLFYLKDRRFKLIGLTLFFVLIYSLLPLAIFPGGFDDGIWQFVGRLRESQKMYFDLMVMGGSGNAFGHSILNSIRIISPGLIADMSLIVSNYSIFCLIALSALASWIFIRPTNFVNTLLICVCLMCLLPFTSTDYKLIHFIIPFAILIAGPDSKLPMRASCQLILIGLIFVPKTWLYLHGDPLASLNSVFNTLIMTVLLGISIFSIPKKKEIINNC